MADEQKTLIDITALKYFYKSLQNVTVLIAPSSVEAASSQNLGRTYFIPADGTYAGVKCSKGDHIVSNGTSWVLIPKGTSEGSKEYFGGDGIDISNIGGKDTITNTGVTAIAEATGDANRGKINVTTNGTSVNIPVHGLGTAAYEAVGTAKSDITSASTKVPNAKAVYEFVDDAISGKLDANQKGAKSGVAELDVNGKVLSSQLPSYVDDVVEASSRSAFPLPGESGKIYVDTTTNLTYRWTGTAYTEISPSIALGETSSTAYRGDRGKTAYDHATTRETNPHHTTKSDVGLGDVGNFKAVSTVASQGLTSTEKSNARANIGAYSKDTNGIPKSDLAQDVQTSLGRADTALQSADVTSVYSSTGKNPVNGTAVASAIRDKENTANKIMSTSGWSSHPLDGNYPSERLVKTSLDLKADKTELLATIVSGSNTSVTNNKTITFNGIGKPLEQLIIEGKTDENGNGVGVIGKNIFDYRTVVRRDGYIVSDDGIETESTAGSGYTLPTIKVSPSTEYTIQGAIGDVVGATTNAGRIYFYDENKVFMSKSGSHTLPFNFNTPKDCKYIGIQYKIENVLLNTIQIEKGATATWRQAYRSTIPVVCNSKTYEFVLHDSLHDGDVFSLADGKVIRSDNSIERIAIPDINTVSGNNTLTIDTSVVPSTLSVSTFEYLKKSDFNKISNDTGWKSYDISKITKLSPGTEIIQEEANHIKFRRIGDVVYFDFRLKMRFTGDNVRTTLSQCVESEFSPLTSQIRMIRSSNYISDTDTNCLPIYIQITGGDQASMKDIILYPANNVKLSTVSEKAITGTGSYLIN